MSTTDRTHTPSDPSTTGPPSDAGRASATGPHAPTRIARRVAGALAAVAGGAVRRLADAGRAVAFWLAALLPLTYLPALATGAAGQRPVALLCVLAGHAAALVLGRGHAADGDADPAARPDADPARAGEEADR